MARKPTKTAPKKPAAKKPAAKKTPAKKTTKQGASDLRSSKKVDEFLNKASDAERKADEAKAEAGHNAQKALFEKINGYFKELADLQKSIKELTGKKGSRVKTILEVEDWNRKGMQLIIQIMGMSEAARADFLRTFYPLFVMLYEKDWKSEMHDLLTQLENEANPEADLQNDVDVDPEFKKVDVLAETAPEGESEEQPEGEKGDPKEEGSGFEADPEELEKMLNEE